LEFGISKGAVIPSAAKQPRTMRLTKEEERFLSARVDRFAGAKREEKVGSLRSK